MYTFVEFKVEIRRGREGKHGHRVTVECEKPDGGRVGPTDAQPITSSVRRLMPALSAEQRIDLGEELGQCMFPPRVLAAFAETLRALQAGTGIRVRLLCVDEEMARWPWELVRIAVPATARPRYLFRDERFSLVRTVIDHRPVDQPKERRKLVILTVDATKVVDDQELEPDFPEQLPQAAPLRRFDLTHPTKRTIDELIDQIADGEDPLDIFHFTGHGRPPRDGQAGSLVLYRDQDTGSEHYRGDELARQLHRAGTSLAFVNACYTDQASPGDGPGIAQALTGIVPVVIAIRSHAFPLFRHLLRRIAIVRCARGISQQFRQLRIAVHSFNRFDRKIRVVRQMPREIVRAQLIFRIESLRTKIVRPLRQQRPVVSRKIRVAFGSRNRQRENQHVARFFHGHLIFFCALAASVHLSIRERISSQVVRGKWPAPAWQRSVIQNRLHLPFHQFRIQKQKQWRRRIKYVHRINASIAEIFLRKK